jgi:hypothetical protein
MTYPAIEDFERGFCAHCQKKLGSLEEALCLDCEQMMLSYIPTPKIAMVILDDEPHCGNDDCEACNLRMTTLIMSRED